MRLLQVAFRVAVDSLRLVGREEGRKSWLDSGSRL